MYMYIISYHIISYHGEAALVAHTTVYLTPDTEQSLKTLKRILDREGSNFSRWISGQIREYVRLHEPGNPQQTVTQYVQHGKPYVAPGKCAYCPRDSVTTGEYEDGKRYRLCLLHAKHFKRSKKWTICEAGR